MENKEILELENQNQYADFWYMLETEEDLEKAKEESKTKPVIIFMHITKCFMSNTVLKSFEQEVAENKPNYSFYLLDLLEKGPLTNTIAKEFNVNNQSQQILLIQNGVALKNSPGQNIPLDL